MNPVALFDRRLTTAVRSRLALIAMLVTLAAGVAAQPVQVQPIGAGTPVTAQTLDPSRLSDAELLTLLDQIENLRRARPRRLGIFAIPSGYGVPRGWAFVAAAATNRRDRGRLGDWDASLAIGFGLGDPESLIGVTPVIDITSVSPDHFGESGRIGVKLSRALPLGHYWRGSVGLDLGNLATWGDSRTLDPEASLAVTVIRDSGPATRVPFMLSFGYGTGIASRGTAPGFLAGIGVGLGSATSASLAWYGDEAIAGVNFWPLRNRNLQISAGIGDIMGNVGGRRLLFAVGIAAPFARHR